MLLLHIQGTPAISQRLGASANRPSLKLGAERFAYCGLIFNRDEWKSRTGRQRISQSCRLAGILYFGVCNNWRLYIGAVVSARQYGSPTIAEDWTAARILPFAAFMGAALLISTFTVTPDLWYFAKAVAISSVLGTYLPLYRARLVWQIDTFAVVAGVAIGLLWIAFGFEDQSRAFALDNALASLPLSLWLGWVLVRLIGTIALVPVAEELFFRGYLLDRFSHNGEATKVIGLLLSTGLFAVMHGRWALAGCAGLVYGLLYLRSSRVTDSIVAHSASNAIIGLYALATAQWSLI